MSSTDHNEEQQKPVCFVLMPIADTVGYETGHFGRVYEHLLKPAIIAAGYHPVRADDTVKTDYIVVGIIQRIVESPMVLCDISAKNPNVMYELGIRHAFNKPVTLIKDRKTEKIFDIQGLRYTEYDDSLRIDSVNKDIIKISTATTETSKSSGRDMNSIVQLAGIKTAEVPAGQTISPDTQLILSAIGAIERRVEMVEERTEAISAYFVVDRRKVIFLHHSDEATLGDTLFSSGDRVGELVGLNPAMQTITVQRADGLRTEISASSATAKNLNSIPF